MEKEFLKYTEALALKELGFNEQCFSTFIYKVPELQWELNFVISDNRYIGTVASPTFSQAFRFFREKYNINYAMRPILGSKNGYDSFPILGWDYDIFITNKDTWNSFYMGYPVGEWFTATLDNFDEGETLSDLNINPTTYEEAELECLKKLIEIVKEKKNETK